MDRINFLLFCYNASGEAFNTLCAPTEQCQNYLCGLFIVVAILLPSSCTGYSLTVWAAWLPGLSCTYLVSVFLIVKGEGYAPCVLKYWLLCHWQQMRARVWYFLPLFCWNEQYFEKYTCNEMCLHMWSSWKLMITPSIKKMLVMYSINSFAWIAIFLVLSPVSSVAKKSAENPNIGEGLENSKLYLLYQFVLSSN